MFPIINQAANAISTLGRSLGDNGRRVSASFEGETKAIEGVSGASGYSFQSALSSNQASVQTPPDPAMALVALQADQQAIESNVRMLRTTNEMVGTLLDIVV